MRLEGEIVIILYGKEKSQLKNKKEERNFPQIKFKPSKSCFSFVYFFSVNLLSSIIELAKYILQVKSSYYLFL